MGIHNLSREVVSEILSHLLPKSELSKARLVCKEFDYLLQPQVFNRISISLHHNPQRSILSSAPMDRFIRNFDPDGLPACEFTRFLDIDKNYPRNSYATNFGNHYRHETVDDLIEIISELENLRGVNWVLGQQIHPRIRQGIMDAITSLDNLREFRFKFVSQPPLFNEIRHLTRLEVHSDVDLPTAWQVVGQLQQVIGNSLNLRYIDVNFNLEGRQRVNLPPLDLFRLVPVNRVLPLEHLSVKGGWGLLLDKYFFSHIRHVHTIELGHMETAAFSGTPNADHIWEGLRRHRVLPKHIKAARASYALFDYMASYSGIEEFHCGKDLASLEDPKTMWQTFLTKVFPRHLNSLRVLDIPNS